MDNILAMQLLEAKINKLVEQVVNEAKKKESDDTVENTKAFTKKYAAIQKALADPSKNVTQIFVKAGIIKSAGDDAGRSLAFKKLHQEKNQSGDSSYKFDSKQVNRLYAAIYQ